METLEEIEGVECTNRLHVSVSTGCYANRNSNILTFKRCKSKNELTAVSLDKVLDFVNQTKAASEITRRGLIHCTGDPIYVSEISQGSTQLSLESLLVQIEC